MGLEYFVYDDEMNQLRLEVRVARAREQQAQLAESAARDAATAAVAVLDDMRLDAFERETLVRSILMTIRNGRS